MNDIIGKPERVTQNRVVKLFKEELGYTYLGDWSDRESNSNIEVQHLTDYLKKAGFKGEQINRAIYQLQSEANNHNRSLYQNNKEVYSLLRYGVSVKVDNKPNETVKFINWGEPLKNDFYIAEEVTLKGPKERRPDLVLYINGIAFGVIELKNSRVTISDGIRQLISNQQPEFNDWFFTTAQILFAGNDSEGLRHGTILTPEKYYLSWKENEEENDRLKLDKYLLKMCDKKRILEIMHDFVLFDGGVKKLPRVHQYFGIKAAQDHVQEKKGGIIWHTQGSGKSIVMVLLAKWILENKPNARVLIVTDREELDEQISERVFKPAGYDIYRTSSGRDLVTQLGKATPRLLCSLVHKFGQRDVEDANWDAFIKELKEQGGKAVGDFFVFVDECHRSHSKDGTFHEAMTAIMPNAVFIGFTGTPLLKKDKASLDVFGEYIHTYKFGEAVDDGVVLDLLYEARDIDQKLGSEDKIDQWFEVKTKGLNSWQKDTLKKKWATMQKVMSSRSRMEKVVSDIIFDFSVKPRLSNDRGNAILVASSIPDACKYYKIFQKETEFSKRCGIITSYEPNPQNVTTKNTGLNTKTDEEIIFETYEEILKNIQVEPKKTKAETYEKKIKKLFIEEPRNMKLLVVVSKLLTGFDAPSCTYLYIDKHMEDHGLFQAICRTNRLDGDDKDFGYIVDYKDLFKKVEKAIAVYSSELDHSSGGADDAVVMKNRVDKAKERLDQAIEAMALVMEPIPAPKGELQSIHYYCGNTEIETDLKEKEPLRSSLYKKVAEFARSYANLADDMDTAGYTSTDVTRIKEQLNQAVNLRDLVRRASGEELDLKAYEADMRHLIDNYIQAEDPEKISNFDDISLLDLIVKSGIAEAIVQKMGKRRTSKETSAEIIENNVRRKIIQERLNDPAYYNKMSALLDEVIKFRKEKAENYEEYLKKIEEIAKKVQTGKSGSTPSNLKTNGQRALYNNLGNNEALALQIDSKVKNIRPADWRGVQTRENVIKQALWEILNDDNEVERIFQIIVNQREY